MLDNKIRKKQKKEYAKLRARGKARVEAVKEVYPELVEMNTIYCKGYTLDKNESVKALTLQIQKDNISNLIQTMHPKKVAKVLCNLIKNEKDLNAIKEYYKQIGTTIDRKQSESKELKVLVNIEAQNDQVMQAIRKATGINE